MYVENWNILFGRIGTRYKIRPFNVGGDASDIKPNAMSGCLVFSFMSTLSLQDGNKK
jgi:hypothetical protein